MPVFRVRVRQWTEETAKLVFVADNEADAHDYVMKFHEQHGDWNWQDGGDSSKLEIVSIEEIEVDNGSD